MSAYSPQLLSEFMEMIHFLKSEILAIDANLSNQVITHENKWLYSKGFDYDFNFYEDFTQKLNTNLNLGGEDIFYCDQLWDFFKEKYGFSVKEISPFFNSEYVNFYFSDDYEGKVEKVRFILTKYRVVKLRGDLSLSSESKSPSKNNLKI
ncbi:hypothetical protein GQ367_02000 [Polynucleobacter sp. MWH-CaK5]|uniref:hypothetical protein n=1 Tax=Polynucleobacter sp. MWH-CaK5 TaxID=2689107 RepID=UPI001BFDD6D6|nr:hypothetical protein [Polynucleobacter sp. MWH-CaK5]QWD89269.1 hypothetical protein GQ367_02000 [Polynucleobacter sp. MWH-CaK5]